VSKAVDHPRVRAGGSVTFTIEVGNPSGRAVDDVRVCDRLPAGLVATDANPRAHVFKGAYCWTVRRLDARSARSFRLTVRALSGVSGRKVGRATASAPDARGDEALRGVRVIAGQVSGGGVTG
jgi:uncharacterized repeat protein (TIGR01451 family)